MRDVAVFRSLCSGGIQHEIPFRANACFQAPNDGSRRCADDRDLACVGQSDAGISAVGREGDPVALARQRDGVGERYRAENFVAVTDTDHRDGARLRCDDDDGARSPTREPG